MLGYLTLSVDKDYLNPLVLIWVRPDHLTRGGDRGLALLPYLPHSLAVTFFSIKALNWHTAIEVNPSGGSVEDPLTSSAGCNWLINQGADWWILWMDCHSLAVKDNELDWWMFRSASIQLSYGDMVWDLFKAAQTGQHCCTLHRRIISQEFTGKYKLKLFNTSKLLS